jgi:hypothetical protein
MMSPITMLATQWVNSVRSAKASALLTDYFPRFRVAAVAAISGFAALTGYANARFLFLLAIGLLAFAGPVVLWNMLATGLFAAALIAGLLWGRVGLPRPHFTLAGASDYADGLSAAVRQSTPADAVILTPPSFGMLRLLARRAIVVDFKNIPFRDRDMRDWYQRILYCYGPVAAAGYAAPDSMDANYRKISDARLKAIHHRYSASFALLYAETVTEYPVVAAAEHLKLVHLVDGIQDRVRQP